MHRGVEDRHRGRQPDRDYNRGQHKRARSAGYPDEFRGGQSQQHVRFSSQPAQSAPPRFMGRGFNRMGYSEGGQSSKASGSQMGRVVANRGHLCFGVLAVVGFILGNVIGLQVRVFLVAVRVIL